MSFFFFPLAFVALFDSAAEEGDRKQGERGGVTHSKWDKMQQMLPQVWL